MKVGTQAYDIYLSFSVPDDAVDDPFGYRGEITEMMAEVAGWPEHHSSGFGFGFGDLAWEVHSDEMDLIASLSVLLDRVGEDMEVIRIRRQVPADPGEFEDDDLLAPEDEAAPFDPLVAHEEAYRKTLRYKPTMDITTLHMWAQNLIEIIQGSSFDPRENL